MRTDWLLVIVEIITRESVGVATFVARRWLCASFIALMVTQSSSLSLARPSLWIST